MGKFIKFDDRRRFEGDCIDYEAFSPPQCRRAIEGVFVGIVKVPKPWHLFTADMCYRVSVCQFRPIRQFNCTLETFAEVVDLLQNLEDAAIARDRLLIVTNNTDEAIPER